MEVKIKYSDIPDLQSRICDLLHELGVSSKYIGFFYTMDAVMLVIDKPQSVNMITKQLYPEIAQRYGVTWNTVERNIRTIILAVWNKRRAELEHMAGFAFENKPNTAQFISILADYVREHYCNVLTDFCELEEY